MQVARLVAGHVKAKRFLVSTEPEYAHILSDASQVTLKAQGGIMSAEVGTERMYV
jgi:predicted HD phosphohydrolase